MSRVPTPSAHAGRGLTVLLVDDDPRVPESIRTSLRKEAYEIQIANSADEALALLDAQRVAVVVSDERMPGMCGSELLGEIHARDPSTVSMILSGQCDMDAAIRAINDGRIFRFFHKPIDPDELRLGIHSAIQQHLLQRELEELRRERLQHEQVLQQLEALHPGITAMNVDEDGAYILDMSQI